MGTGFPKRSCSNKKIERDDHSKGSHPDRETSCKNATEIPDEGEAGDLPAILKIASREGEVTDARPL
jgi:hypothetical protein